MVDSLLNHGANPSHLAEKYQHSPIAMAAKEGHKSIVERLVKGGVRIDEKNGLFTPLEAASGEGHVDVVDFLLSHEQAKKMILHFGRRALEKASRKGNIDVVDRLLAAGCDVQPPY